MQRPRTTYKFSPELAALLEALLRQGHVARSDATRVNNNISVKVDAERKLKQANKRIANEHTAKHFAKKEADRDREAKRAALESLNKLNSLLGIPLQNIEYGPQAINQGTIQDGWQAKIDKAYSDYGISNALGQMTNVSDAWRATPSFGIFMGKDVPMSMVMAGQAVANPIGFAGAMGAGYLGSELGAKVGEYYGNEELGRTVGSLATMPFGYKAATSNATKNFILSRAINQATKNGVKETSTFLPTIFDMTKPLNWDRNIWDTQYFNAIKRGDMAEAQRLRDLRFQQASGNDVEVFAHTTHNKFNNFDKSHFGETDKGFNGKGFYFSTTRPSNNPNIPTSIKGPHGEIYTMNYGPNKMYVYLKGNKEFNVGDPERNFFNEPNTIGVVDEYLYKNNKPTEIIIGNSNNIKSANAIVRDDSGNIVPLYDRDNFLVDDIRGLVHNTYNHPGAFVNLEEAFTPVTRQFVHPSEAIRKAYTAPNLERLEMTTAEPLMNRSAVGKLNYDPNEVVNKPLNITKGKIADFYNRFGHLSEDEMLALGILRNTPNGPLVIIDGKPMGSFRKIYEHYKNEVYAPKETPKPKVVEESVKPLLTGDKRDAQLQAVWNKATESIKDLKEQHPVNTEMTEFNDVTNLSLQLQAKKLRSPEGRIELPLTNLWLDKNPEASAYVDRVIEGKEGVPINPETGEPIIITGWDEQGNPIPTNKLASVLAYYNGDNRMIGSQSELTRDEPFFEGLRGSLPRLDRRTLLPNGDTSGGGKDSYGNINFSTDNLLASINYADVLTHDLLLYVLKELNLPISKQSIDYAMAVLDNIRNQQIQKGIKLGKHNSRFHTGFEVPRSGDPRNQAVKGSDARRSPGIFKTGDNPDIKDWKTYISDMLRYNRFLGPYQGYGGLRTVLMRRPRYTWEKYVDLKERPYNDLGGLKINDKEYYNILELERDLGNDSGFQGIDLINGKNPLIMNTYIAPKNSYFYGMGMKKGGKLYSKNRTFDYFLKINGNNS